MTVKDKIKCKIMDIEQEMDSMKGVHLYYLTMDWKICVAKVQVLNELLTEIR